jgi:hypothetical protein
LPANADAIADADARGKQAADGVERERASKIAAAAAAHGEELVRLESIYKTQAAALRQGGEERAKAIETVAEGEAKRAVEECGNKVPRAWVTLAKKLPLYRTYDRKDRIEVVLQEMTAKTVESVTEAGAEIGKSVRGDAADLAGKFRHEAGDGAENMSEGRAEAHGSLADKGRGVNDAINQIAGGALGQIETARTKTIADLRRQSPPIVASLQATAQAARPAILKAAEEVCDGIARETDQRALKLNRVASVGSRRLTPLRGKVLADSLVEARTELDETANGHRHNLHRVADDAVKTLRERGGRMLDDLRVNTAVMAAAPPQAAQASVEAINKMAGEAALKIDEVAKTAADKMRGGVDKVEADLKTRVHDACQTWQRELDASTQKMKRKVDAALAEQEKLTVELGQRLQDKAEEIENESWLSRGLKRLGGWFVGILEAAWDMLVGILEVLGWVFLGLVILVAVIALIALVLPELAAALAIGLVVAVGAFAGFVATWATAIGVIAVIGMAAWSLYQAHTTKGLNDFDMGRAYGRATFDVGSIFLGGKIFGWLGKLTGQVGRLLGLVGGDEARMARLLKALGGDEARLQSAVEAFGGDAAHLDRMVTAAGSGSRLEGLLGLLGRDGAKVERLLGALGSDGAKLEILLGRAGGDAQRLEYLIGAVDGSAARLETLLKAAGGDSARLEHLLQTSGVEAARLESLMGAAGRDVQRAESALAAAEGDLAPAEKALKAPPFEPKPPTPTAEPTKVEAPKVEAPKAEPPKVEPPKPEPPKAEPPKPEPPKTEPAPAQTKPAAEKPPPTPAKEPHPSGMSREEFVAEYRRRNPRTKFSEEELRKIYDEGRYVINERSGLLNDVEAGKFELPNVRAKYVTNQAGEVVSETIAREKLPAALEEKGQKLAQQRQANLKLAEQAEKEGNLAARNEAMQEARVASRKLGEDAAKEFGKRFEGPGVKVTEGGGARDFDLTYTGMGPAADEAVILEAKGGASDLGTRFGVDGVTRVEQGTEEYLRAVIKDIASKDEARAEKLLEALEAKKLKYFEVRQGVTPTGELAPIEIKEFSLW